MAGTVRFKLNRPGVAALLKLYGQAVDPVAEKVADNTRSIIGDDGVEVTVTPYTSDRAAALITIADPRGIELQVSKGALTRAASAVGLEVKSK